MRVVSSPPKSELESFASFFHQDWALVYDNFYVGARTYIKGLPGKRRLELKAQLTKFIERHENPNELKRAWHKLGAHAWQKDLMIRETLRDFIDML